MATAEEQDAQFTAGDVERRVAELERKLALLNEAGLDRLTQSGYLQFDGMPMRFDSNGMQIVNNSSTDAPALFYVPDFRPDPDSTTPYSTLEGYANVVVGDEDVAAISIRAAGESTIVSEVGAETFNVSTGIATAYLSAKQGGTTATLTLGVAAGVGTLDLSNAQLPAADVSITDAGGYFTATDVEAALQEIMAAGGSSMPMPPIVGTYAWNCLGTELGVGNISPASATWPANNRVIGIPVKVTEDCTVTKLWVYNGATANANINMCLYDASFGQIANSEMGSTAQAGTNAIQEFDITNVDLTAGLYYIACVFSATTGTAIAFNPTAIGAEGLQSWGMWQQDLGDVNLLATATPAASASSYVPIMGMSISPRTLVT